MSMNKEYQKHFLKEYLMPTLFDKREEKAIKVLFFSVLIIFSEYLSRNYDLDTRQDLYAVSMFISTALLLYFTISLAYNVVGTIIEMTDYSLWQRFVLVFSIVLVFLGIFFAIKSIYEFLILVRNLI